jgi:hypothetical protein
MMKRCLISHLVVVFSDVLGIVSIVSMRCMGIVMGVDCASMLHFVVMVATFEVMSATLVSSSTIVQIVLPVGPVSAIVLGRSVIGAV